MARGPSFIFIPAICIPFWSHAPSSPCSPVSRPGCSQQNYPLSFLSFNNHKNSHTLRNQSRIDADGGAYVWSALNVKVSQINYESSITVLAIKKA